MHASSPNHGRYINDSFPLRPRRTTGSRRRVHGSSGRDGVGCTPVLLARRRRSGHPHSLPARCAPLPRESSRSDSSPKSLNQIPFLVPSITEDAALAMSPNKRWSQDRSPGFHRHLRHHCKPVKTLEFCVQSCICVRTSEIAISSFPHVLQLASPRTMVLVLRIPATRSVCAPLPTPIACGPHWMLAFVYYCCSPYHDRVLTLLIIFYYHNWIQIIEVGEVWALAAIKWYFSYGIVYIV